MKSNYKRLGDYIRQVDVRNKDLVVRDLRGLSMTKQFRASTSNIVGVDLSKYKVVNPNVFAFDTMSVIRVHKVPMVLNNLGFSVIISPAYITFEVVNKDEINSDYLFMYFQSPGFDRYADFKSDASVRGGYNWEELCNTLIPIPPIEEQREIVAEYQAIEQRIENNRRLMSTLEATAQTIYRKMFVDDIDMENLPEGWKLGTIDEFGMVVTGKTPSSNCPNDFGSAIDFITPSEFSGEYLFCTKAKRGLSLDGITKLQGKLIPKCSIAVTCIGSDMGKVRICPKECISNQQINSIIMSDKNEMPFLFFTLRNMKDDFQRIALGSSTMPMLSKSEFEKIKVLLPSKICMDTFAGQTFPIIKFVMSLESEIHILQQTQHIILSRLINL